jgi:tripartite ATP-independent transporter DctM subunit
MSSFTVGILGIFAIIVLLFSGMPVALVLTLVGFLGFCVIVNPEAALSLLAKDLFGETSNYSLTVIPMFILMGQFAFYSGAGNRAFDSAHKLFGRVRGGLALATTLACAIFGAVCGSTNAGAAAMGAVCIPEMRRYNYHPALSTGCVAAGGSLSILIPPSVIFIVYGILTQISVGKLFLAGILPGVLLTLLFMAAIYVVCRFHPEYGPAGAQFSLKEKILSLKGLIDILILFILVMGGLFIGFFTPNEAGAVGAGGALLLALIKRQITFQGFIMSFLDTARLSCMIMFILVGSAIFGHFISVSRVPFMLATWVGATGLSDVVIVAMIIAFYLIGGCFISTLALIMITVPIFFPLIQTINFDPILFGVIIVLVTEMGVITPPVGVNVYIIKGIAPDIPLEIIFKGIIPFFVALIVETIIVISFPQITLFLPNLLH